MLQELVFFFFICIQVSYIGISVKLQGNLYSSLIWGEAEMNFCSSCRELQSCSIWLDFMRLSCLDSLRHGGMLQDDYYLRYIQQTHGNDDMIPQICFKTTFPMCKLCLTCKPCVPHVLYVILHMYKFMWFWFCEGCSKHRIFPRQHTKTHDEL